MSAAHEPSADPVGPSATDLASRLTGLRQQLDAALREFEDVRTQAEAKVLSLYSQLKRISAEMSTLEAVIRRPVTDAADASEPSATSGDKAVVRDVADEESSSTEAVEQVAADAETTAAESAGAPQAGDEGSGATEAVVQSKPVAPQTNGKQPTTADDVAAAMLMDLALGPPARPPAPEPAVVRSSTDHEHTGAHTHMAAQATQAAEPSPFAAVLELEFGEYLEASVAPLPAPGPTLQPDDAKNESTDDWQ
jgi:hypothetical protein